MLTTIAVGVAFVITVLCVIASMKPDTLRVQRETVIKGSPAKIFPLINDFHSWGAWSPWEQKDPGMKRTHSGAASGKGAVYEWSGNRNVGSGRMEITGSSPSSSITIKLDFITPFEGHNVTTFTLEPDGDATHVTWVMTGPSRFITKLMQIFINMDTMIGKDFEIGLANLKAITGTPSQP
jgi:Polyketide cyclase / dehydrase and lipid transport